MIKKILIGILFIVLIFGMYILFQHQRPPEIEDVYKSTKKWSPSISNVYTVEKVNDEWIAFFSNDNTLFLGRLEKNWVGSWEVTDYSGNVSSLGSTTFYSENKGVVWGVSSVQGPKNHEVSFYYGMITDYDIQKLIIGAEGNVYNDIPLIEANGKRFFFLKREGHPLPFSFKALSKEGDTIFSH